MSMEYLNQIKYWIIDVDGTMTDGGIYYDMHGNETKKFCTKDAAGFFAAQNSGMRVMVLTGRECAATERRMKELHVELLYQNIKNKAEFLKKFMETNSISSNEIAYIGDDLNDIPPMRMAGFIGCPADSCKEVREIADYISEKNGGCGAVRDIIEYALRKLGLWDRAVGAVYGIGI